MINTISIKAGSDSTVDLYLDNIFLGGNVISLSEREMALNLVVPTAVPQVKLDRVEVERTESSITVTYIPIDCGHQFPLLGFAFASTSNKPASTHHSYIFGDETSTSAQIHVYRNQSASPSVTGTFDLSFADPGYRTLTGLPADVETEAFKYELETLQQVQNVEVTRTGTCYGYTWDVKFKSPNGDFPAMEPDGSGLRSSPDRASISATEISNGGLNLDPIRGDFFRTAHSVPQVQVFINHVPSHCVGHFDGNNMTSCDYQWMTSATPDVTMISPLSGSSGDRVTLIGTLFSAIASENEVKIGNVSCIVISATSTEIVCSMGNSPAGDQPVMLSVSGKGLASINSTFAWFQVSGSVTSFSPTSGSQNGCTELAISGSGFDRNSIVTLGEGRCEISSFTYTSIRCLTPTAPTAGPMSVQVTTAGVAVTAMTMFNYVTVGVASVSSLSSTTLLTVDGGTNVTITGSGFGATDGELLFGTTKVDINSWTNNEISVLSPSLPSGSYRVKVVVLPLGCALGSHQVTYGFSVSSISPQSGSLMGGTTVTLSGAGFTEESVIKFGDTSCSDVVVSDAGDSATCTTQPAAYGIGYAWNPSTLEIQAGDLVAFSWSFPDLVEGSNTVGLFTTSDPSSEEYDGVGFEAQPAALGRFNYRFNQPGTYHYGSGCVDDNCNVFMRGTVIVSEPSSSTKALNVTLNRHEAEYATGGYDFSFEPSLTPTVTSISPNTGTTDTKITIKGSGFSAKPVVTVGGKMCEVSTYTGTLVNCKILSSGELEIAIYHEVSVNVPGKGDARIEITNALQRTFVLLPLVTSVIPTSGSVAGGTKVTVQGSGFKVGSVVQIANGAACDVTAEESDYSTVVCVTRATNSETSGPLEVSVGATLAACKTTCAFVFAGAATPMVSGRVDAGDFSDLTITFNGQNFGDVMADVTIKLKSGDLTKTCNVSSAVNDEIVCNIQRFPVGENIITLHVAGKGYASFWNPASATIESPSIINSTSPRNGFVDDDTTEVLVGDSSCVIQTVSLNAVTCITASHAPGLFDVIVVSNSKRYPPQLFNYSSSETPTISSVSPVQATGGSRITLTGTGLGSNPSDVTVIVGDVSCDVTSSTDTTIECTLGAREGGPAAIEVLVSNVGNAIVEADFKYTLSLTSFSPNSGSYGGGQRVTINGQGFSSNTMVKICNSPCLAELVTIATEIICYTPANENMTEGSTECPVVVVNGNEIASAADPYTYQSAMSPTIADVSPRRGGTAGGTRITITGTGFSLGAPSVSIDGSECVIMDQSSTSITCETEPHYGAIQTKVSVQVGDLGNATQGNVEFFYIDRWSSVFTWGGVDLPVQEDFVIIQKGQTVLLDTHTPVLKMLLIDGGELIFDEAPDANVSLRAENILITKGGRLQIGTEEEPYQGQAEIVMYGNLRSPELPIYGAKTLGVRNGTLDLHGRHIPNPWTKLTSTAEAGDTQINLELQATNWRVGDYVIIASTGTRHSQKENEKRRIQAISGDGLTITLDQPLGYKHLGITEVIDGIPVEFRGKPRSGYSLEMWSSAAPTIMSGTMRFRRVKTDLKLGRFGEEVGSDQFGGSIMMHSSYPDSPWVMSRIENIEVTYAGQAFRLGRYPIHFHLMGNVSGMYVKRCSIHNTFNRAVTIHGTHNLLVDSNVVYDIMGGAIFIEDGIETGNLIQYNLAVFVRQSTSLLNDDITPAAYWVTNPDNTVRHNHAAGGTHFGFWYRMHEHPDGPSYDPNVCQQKVELLEFRNNTVHSQGWFGLWIFQSYFPMKGSSCDSTVPSPAVFKTLTTWHCEKGAEWVNCGAIQFEDFLLVNNEEAAIDVKLISGTKWGDAKITNAVIIGHSEQSEPNYETKIGITLPFAPGLFVDGTKFINFDRRGKAFEVTTVQGTCSVDCGGFYYWVERLEFTSVTKKVGWRWPHEGVIIDRDGSLTGIEYASVLPYTGLIDKSVCPISEGDEFSSGEEKSSICQRGPRFHRFALNNPLPSSLEANDIIFVNEHGNASSIYKKKRLTHKPGWMALLPGRKEVMIYFKDGEQFTNITYNSKYYDLMEDDYLIVKHQLTQRPDIIKINGESRFSVGNTTELNSGSSNLDWHYVEETKELKVMVSGKTSSRKRRSFGIVQDGYKHVTLVPNIYRCLYANCIGPVSPEEIPPPRGRPEIYQRWSELNPCLEWSEDRLTVTVKRETENIDACWVVVDVAEINVVNLTVEGVLEFETDTYLSAVYIAVLNGRMIAGFSELEPFRRNLTIELRGTHTTPGWIFPGVDLGSKAIGCFGGCDFHGVRPNVYWTHLEQTVGAGSDQIVLRKAVDWSVGNEIVITTTSFNSTETEKHVIRAVGEDMKTLTLERPLAYRHLGESYNVGEFNFDMRAEVGLLTRNIKIKSETYSDIDRQAFGARVLVGTFQTTQESQQVDILGWARVSNVEFFQSGQEGWTEPYDPRFSLAWVNTGATTPARPSYVKGCAFHDGYSTAIGTFGAEGINITDNVVHRTIHDGIRLTGSGHRLERNLVTVTLFRGTYLDRLELTNFKDWQASFEVAETTNLIMNGNTAAGSERLCFHFDGEACDAPLGNAWTGNVAHGCLHGLQIFINDGVGTCSLIRNFVVYKAWDYGVYHQTKTSVVIRNTIIADSNVGYLPLIYGPAALSHEYSDKSASVENVLCVGRSDSFDPDLDTMDENDDNLVVRAYSPSKKSPLTPTGGKTCLLLPLFQSNPNAAPFKPFHVNLNYPAIRGLLNITGLHAHNYRQHADETRDLVFYTNPLNGDAFHPTYLRNVILTNVEEASKVFFARPDLGKVNPSDCVDMECDAKKKVFIKDFDGGFLGEAGSVLPQAEFGWDNPEEIRRGLGDYRIPKPMLTATDGSRIEVSDIADLRGIIRNSACTYNNEWQAHDCHGPDALDYRMLVIESMDSDTETRRLSPVAMLGDRCLDLNNGPQDHGWCFGYTCQLRISTFYTIVATGEHFNIFFTGNAPRNLRLHLLNVDDSSTVRVAIWYTKPERLDVVRVESGFYVHPENSVYDPDQEKWVLQKPSTENPDEFLPAIDSAVHGANYMDYNTNLLYITLRGKEAIEIKTVEAVVIKFGFPAVNIDDFFEENLVNNLADYLGVPSYKIRVVEVVRETSSRKRRETNGNTVTFTIVFSDEITNSTVSGDADLTAEVLNNKTETMLVDYQTGHLWELINVTEGLSLATSPAATNVTSGGETFTLVQHAIPTKLVVSSLPSTVEEYLAFEQQPSVAIYDSNDEVVSTLGGQWEVEVSLDTSASTADDGASLLGRTSVPVSSGYANFTDLKITHAGTGYVLRFRISEPSGVSLTSNNPTIDVVARSVKLGFPTGVNAHVNHGDALQLNVELQNANDNPLENVGFKGHVWQVDVSLDDATMYGDVSISGPTTFTFNPSTGRATTNGLMLLNTVSYHKYNLICRVYTNPPAYDFTQALAPVQFISTSESLHLTVVNIKKLKVEFSGRPYARSLTSSTELTFSTYFHNALVDEIDFVYFNNLEATEKQDGNTEVAFDIGASSTQALDWAVSNLTSFLLDPNNGLEFGGAKLQPAQGSCLLVVDEKCNDDVINVGQANGEIESWVFVVIGAVAAILLAAAVITFSCVMKRAKTNKVGGFGGCMDASTSRTCSPVLESFDAKSSAESSPTGMFHRRMTPVKM
ncbi:unnamed protein product [Clavelina lepadiformis]|uniref:G8 domain-containing protein n=1 Tax=Clavelina lepadiformis TaxID=159417 RepID=A0ABP0F7W2_CLALP